MGRVVARSLELVEADAGSMGALGWLLIGLYTQRRRWRHARRLALEFNASRDTNDEQSYMMDRSCFVFGLAGIRRVLQSRCVSLW